MGSGPFGCERESGGDAQEALRARAWFYPPPEFAHAGTQFTEPELFWIIKHGIRRTAMSAYGLPGDYSEEQLWLLADFVEHMKSLPPSVQAAILPGRPQPAEMRPDRLCEW